MITVGRGGTNPTTSRAFPVVDGFEPPNKCNDHFFGGICELISAIQTQAPLDAPALAASLHDWLVFELEMYGRSPGHVGVDAHGAVDWFARFAVKWAHKLHEIDPGGSPRGSVSVYRHMPVPASELHARGKADPVIYRAERPDIYVKIEPEQSSGCRAPLRAVESAARAEQVAVFVNWRQRSPMQLTQLR